MLLLLLLLPAVCSDGGPLPDAGIVSAVTAPPPGTGVRDLLAAADRALEPSRLVVPVAEESSLLPLRVSLPLARLCVCGRRLSTPPGPVLQ